MKILIFLFSFLFITQLSFAKEIEISNYLIQSTFDKSLKKGQSKYLFTFPSLNSKKFLIHYSIDETEKRLYLKKGDTLTIMSSPGEHNFQFYTSQNYAEVYLNKALIKNRYVSLYSINFTPAQIMDQCEKPVIYLYPEKKKTVSIQLKVKGDLIMTYPEYNEGWEVKAQPNGELEINKKTYNYLFWESNLIYKQDGKLSNKGFIVAKENTISFLNRQLTLAGLNSKEQADFITYWGPRLLQNEFNYIRFEFNDACNQFAELNIIPKPDQVYRIYITWRKSNGNETKVAQKIIPLKRSGFTVLEWGGIEIKETILKETSIKLLNSL